MNSMTGALRGDDFEWFNAWWDQSRTSPRSAGAVITPLRRRASDKVKTNAPRSAGHALAAATRAALMARDIADIEKARDQLLAGVDGTYVRAKASAPARPSTNSGPVLLGSVIGVLVIAVSTAAAAFMKFAR